MSREIKFRAYTFGEGLKKSMCRVKKIDFSDGEITCEHDYKFKFGEFELMQFTGLKDCNGVDIYEGDILRFGSCVEVVFYEPTIGRFMTELKKCNDESEIGEISSLSPYYTDNYEVIGNIYENSELLK